MYTTKVKQQVLLKDLLSRLIVGLEFSHTSGLKPNDVFQVIHEIKLEDPTNSDISTLLDEMYKYYKSTLIEK